MHDLLGGAVGEHMDLDAYRADFEKHFWTTTAPGFWKLERQQYFKEPSHESWQAFVRGDWRRALHIIEKADRPCATTITKSRPISFTTRRARVVKESITGYLQWEMQILRMRDESGGTVRIVIGDQVAEFKQNAPLPAARS
ncbi:MAG: hypothetical protein HKP61_22340 [Dactylosporangium sp.]|nr:hypothetical protein [Dactylosporangium sp.]NNJ63616.1 hypothetical protein [Dactylosporangium sp.]